MSFLKLLARVLPQGMREKYSKMVGYSTLKTNPDTFIGFAITAGIVAGFLLTIATNGLKPPWPLSMPLVMFTVSFTAMQLLIYIWLTLNVSAKGRQVETALPDALQLMSSNIRAGLTTDKALLMSARPEFGALEEEIRRVGKETMAGRNLTDALSRMTLHIKSTDLSRTVELITNSIKSGGQLADLLDQTADDLRDQQIIQKEISASVLMYVLFIFIAIAIGAPMLFAMSSFLVDLLARNMAMISREMPKNFDGAAKMPIKMTGLSISTEFIKQYAVISISISCIMGAMIMGLILKGEEKEGFKYVIIMLPLALIIFFAASWGLEMTIGGMMPR
ncbi:MAG: type II secretion system F family protein [Candidatus Altiarchaeota archaeon]